MKKHCIIFPPVLSPKTGLSGLAKISVLFLLTMALLLCPTPSLSRADDMGETIDDSGSQSSSQSWWSDPDLDEAVVRLTETLVEQESLKVSPCGSVPMTFMMQKPV